MEGCVILAWLGTAYEIESNGRLHDKWSGYGEDR